jgi:hypothetical protein
MPGSMPEGPSTHGTWYPVKQVLDYVLLDYVKPLLETVA